MSDEHDLIDGLVDQLKKRNFAPDMPPAARFERRVVAFTLKKHKQHKALHEMYDQHQKEHGSPHANLSMFRERFPDFPVYLQAKRIKLSRIIPIEYLASHKKIVKVPVVKGWLESEDRPDADIFSMSMPRAMVFEWVSSGAAGSLWVMHDDSSMKDAVLQVNRMPQGKLKVPLRFGLQPFSMFLENLGWSPSA